MTTLLAESTDIDALAAEEAALPPGIYEVRFYLTEPIADDELQGIYDHLYYNDVDVLSVRQRKARGLPYVAVKYRRNPSPENIAFALPTAVIPLIAFGFIITLIGIGIFKLEDITRNLMPIVLAIGGFTVLGLALARRPAMAYMERRY